MKRKLLTIFVSLILLFVLIAVLYFVFRDSVLLRAPMLVMEKARITFVLGEVKYRLGGGDYWKRASVGLSLNRGAEVETKEKSRADIRFNDETAIRLSENSHFVLNAQNIRVLVLSLEKGSIYGKFKRLFEKQQFIMRTETTVVAVRGTELGIETMEVDKIEEDVDEKPDNEPKGKVKKKPEKEPEKERATLIYTLSGITEVYNPRIPEEKVLLSHQSKATIRRSAPPENPEKMSEDEIDMMQRILNSIHTEEVLFISDKILFETGSAVLLVTSQEELNKVFDLLLGSGIQVRIEGHTDNVGSASFNQILSGKRAMSVKRYLIERGIEPERLLIAGFGSSKPIADNATMQGRALNRRVEFIIIE
jgi:outer membrane protein OmpA-like peptidoglycan-associated protein